jgi:hypothetical protein
VQEADGEHSDDDVPDDPHDPEDPEDDDDKK